MKVLDWIFAILISALGIFHCAMTAAVYGDLSLPALWFFGAGLALLFAGMLNVARLEGRGRPLPRIFASVANASTLLLVSIVSLKAGLRHNPQSVVLLIALSSELLFSVVRRG